MDEDFKEAMESANCTPPSIFSNAQNIIFIAISAVSIPLYIVILLTLIWKRRTRKSPFQEVFYHIVMSQGLADILAMIFYTFGTMFRRFGIAPQFFLDNRNFLAPISINSTYFFVALRCFGDSIFAVQRLIVFRFSDTKLHEKIMRSTQLKVFIVHWLPPLLVSLPSFISYGTKTFSILDCMVADAGFWFVEKNFILVLCGWVVATFTITFLADIYIIYFVSSYSAQSPLRTIRELSLALIVLGQALGFSFILLNYVLHALLLMKAPVLLWMTVSDLFPLIHAFASYLSPWLYITLNGQLREEVLRFICKVLFSCKGCSKTVHFEK